MQRSIRTIYAIASTSLQGCYSQNVTWILTLAGVILIAFGELLFPFNFGENFKACVDVATSAAFMCGTLMAIWNSVYTIKQDLASKTLWTILTKPVSRVDYLLGKALGAWLATLSAYLIWTPIFLVTAWVELAYQRSDLEIGYNCLIIYCIVGIIVVGFGYLAGFLIYHYKWNRNDIICAIPRFKWIAAAWIGLGACVQWGDHSFVNTGHAAVPALANAFAHTHLEWRIVPTMLALTELHFLTVAIGITAALIGSLPMALLGTLVIGFGAELVPALWIPSFGAWMPFPAADGLRLSQPLTEVLSLRQPIGSYWLALGSQTLPWLAFTLGILMLARYYLAQHDLADS
ncbi:MAG: ABC transporter permease subunit [Planctomycetota bacterium]